MFIHNFYTRLFCLLHDHDVLGEKHNNEFEIL